MKRVAACHASMYRSRTRTSFSFCLFCHGYFSSLRNGQRLPEFQPHSKVTQMHSLIQNDDQTSATGVILKTARKHWKMWNDRPRRSCEISLRKTCENRPSLHIAKNRKYEKKWKIFESKKFEKFWEDVRRGTKVWESSWNLKILEYLRKPPKGNEKLAENIEKRCSVTFGEIAWHFFTQRFFPLVWF